MILASCVSACAPTARRDASAPVDPVVVEDGAVEGAGGEEASKDASSPPAPGVSAPHRPPLPSSSGPSVLVEGAPPTIIICHDPANGWLEHDACAAALPAGVDLGLFGVSARLTGTAPVVSEIVGTESSRLLLEPELEVDFRSAPWAPGVLAWPYAHHGGAHPVRVGEWDDFTEVLGAARPLTEAVDEATARAVAGVTGHGPASLELMQRETIRRVSGAGEPFEATFTSLVCVAPECQHYEGCEGECDPDEHEPYQDHYLVVEEVGEPPALVAHGPRAWLLEGHTDMDGSGVPELLVMLPARVYDEAAWIARGDDLGAASPGWGVRLRWQKQTWARPDEIE